MTRPKEPKQSLAERSSTTHQQLVRCASDIISASERLQTEALRKEHHFLLGDLEVIAAAARRAIELSDQMCSLESLSDSSRQEQEEELDEDEARELTIKGFIPAEFLRDGDGKSSKGGNGSSSSAEKSGGSVEGARASQNRWALVPTGDVGSVKLSMSQEFALGEVAIPPEEWEMDGRSSSMASGNLPTGFIVDGYLDIIEQGHRSLSDASLSRRSEQLPRPQLSRAPSVIPSVQPKGAVLVVDDNPIDRNLLARHLFLGGFAVCTAEGGPQALETLSSEPFDVVLLDLVMGGMDGFEVLQAIRKNASVADLPVIVLLQGNSEVLRNQAFELGANDFLVKKPFDGPLALTRIKTQLALKRAVDFVCAMNEQLVATQERLARVVDSLPDSYDDVFSWIRIVSQEVAGALAVPEVSVWVLDQHQELRLVTGNGALAPTPEELDRLMRSNKPLRRDRVCIVPAVGFGRELFGLMAVPDFEETVSPLASQLVNICARRLGAALEVKHVRDILAGTGAERRSMGDGGDEQEFDLLQVCPKCGRCYDQTAQNCAADDSSLDSTRPLAYHLAGRYRLVRILGEGAMGTVFLAVDRRLAREVAVKVIHPSQFGNPSVRKRFVREARAIARINHPNIISVYDTGNLKSGSVYIVMERLRGRDLGHLMQTIGPGTPKEVGMFLRQAAAALGAAHKARLLHRDIKPENIFFVPAEYGFYVKIVDFGLAKDFGGGDGSMSCSEALMTQSECFETKVGTVLGTPLFMAPEQAMGKKVDIRSDVYSLAAVAFFALTGQYLSKSDGLVRILLDILQIPPPLLSSAVGYEVPSEVDQAFLAAMSKDPDDRPPGAESWTQSFVDALEGIPCPNSSWLDESGIMRV